MNDTQRAQAFRQAKQQAIGFLSRVLWQLAEDRARAIKAFLVNEAQLPADRAVIEQVAAADPAHLFSGAEMDIEV